MRVISETWVEKSVEFNRELARSYQIYGERLLLFPPWLLTHVSDEHGTATRLVAACVVQLRHFSLSFASLSLDFERLSRYSGQLLPTHSTPPSELSPLPCLVPLPSPISFSTHLSPAPPHYPSNAYPPYIPSLSQPLLRPPPYPITLRPSPLLPSLPHPLPPPQYSPPYAFVCPYTPRVRPRCCHLSPATCTSVLSSYSKLISPLFSFLLRAFLSILRFFVEVLVSISIRSGRPSFSQPTPLVTLSAPAMPLSARPSILLTYPSFCHPSLSHPANPSAVLLQPVHLSPILLPARPSSPILPTPAVLLAARPSFSQPAHPLSHPSARPSISHPANPSAVLSCSPPILLLAPISLPSSQTAHLSPSPPISPILLLARPSFIYPAHPSLNQPILLAARPSRSQSAHS
ncbi:hypothetical protein C7M84_001613 [Penaeus vannamei]|uniref:Uncharacterized protein n=1 Tax=Penaeus vannamei TaxID=6689 RepID=A0A3R7N7Z3_PENVA|nr:hypothetical protein C7M84_001613 [Penaeus vannamei]